MKQTEPRRHLNDQTEKIGFPRTRMKHVRGAVFGLAAAPNLARFFWPNSGRKLQQDFGAAGGWGREVLHLSRAGFCVCVRRLTVVHLPVCNGKPARLRRAPIKGLAEGRAIIICAHIRLKPRAREAWRHLNARAPRPAARPKIEKCVLDQKCSFLKNRKNVFEKSAQDLSA